LGVDFVAGLMDAEDDGSLLFFCEFCEDFYYGVCHMAIET
jgi:hypothetical protein